METRDQRENRAQVDHPVVPNSGLRRGMQEKVPRFVVFVVHNLAKQTESVISSVIRLDGLFAQNVSSLHIG